MAKKGVAGEKPVLNPLNQNDLAGARAVLDTADEADGYLERCTNCFVDVTPIKEQVEAYRQFARAVLANFEQGAKDA